MVWRGVALAGNGRFEVRQSPGSCPGDEEVEVSDSLRAATACLLTGSPARSDAATLP